MKKMLIVILLSLLGVFGCGGGGSSIGGVYGSTVVYVVEFITRSGSNVQSDIFFLTCSGNRNVPTFQDDVVLVKFKAETIRDALGNPVTQNPSPVFFSRYRVSYFSGSPANNCERHPSCKQLMAGGHEGMVGFTVYPNLPQEPILITKEFPNGEVFSSRLYPGESIQEVLVLPSGWKSSTLLNYCLTPSDNCIYNGVIEFYGRELYSGKEKVVRASFTIQIADYIRGSPYGSFTDIPCQ